MTVGVQTAARYMTTPHKTTDKGPFYGTRQANANAKHKAVTRPVKQARKRKTGTAFTTTPSPVSLVDAPPAWQAATRVVAKS